MLHLSSRTPALPRASPSSRQRAPARRRSSTSGLPLPRRHSALRSRRSALRCAQAAVYSTRPPPAARRSLRTGPAPRHSRSGTESLQAGSDASTETVDTTGAGSGLGTGRRAPKRWPDPLGDSDRDRSDFTPELGFKQIRQLLDRPRRQPRLIARPQFERDRASGLRNPDALDHLEWVQVEPVGQPEQSAEALHEPLVRQVPDCPRAAETQPRSALHRSALTASTGRSPAMAR